MEHITSRSNRWIKCALRLKQRKWRDKEDLFLLEGFRGTTDVLEQQVKDCICFVEDGRFSDDVLEKITVEGERLHWLFLSVDEEMMNLISGTEHGQGILLLCRKQQHDLSELLHPLKGYYVVLDSVQDPISKYISAPQVLHFTTSVESTFLSAFLPCIVCQSVKWKIKRINNIN